MSKHNGDRASQIQPEELTAYALGQLQGDRLAAVKAAVGKESHSAAGEEIREVQSLATTIQQARTSEPLPAPSADLRSAVEARLKELAATEPAAGKPIKPAVELPTQRRPWDRRWIVGGVLAGGVCSVLAVLYGPTAFRSDNSQLAMDNRPLASFSSDQIEVLKEDLKNEQAARTAAIPVLASRQVELDTLHSNSSSSTNPVTPSGTTDDDDGPILLVKPRIIADEAYPSSVPASEVAAAPANQAGQSQQGQAAGDAFSGFPTELDLRNAGKVPPTLQGRGYGGGIAAGSPGPGAMAGYGGASGYASGGPAGMGMPGDSRKGGGGYGGMMAGGGQAGGYPGSSSGSGDSRSWSELRERRVQQDLDGKQSELDTNGDRLQQGGAGYSVVGPVTETELQLAERTARDSKAFYDGYYREEGRSYKFQVEGQGGEQYESIVENAYLSPLSDPLSTFSIDVDTASYANVRRFLNSGSLPPPAAVRIEELVNYFTYSYPQPTGKEPFSVHMEAAECPWNAGHVLLRVGLKGKEVHRSERPPSNLTFLLDVSGSMADENKLPLLKATLLMMVAELTENDRVSIVTYAGEAGLRLPPTRGNEKQKIMAAIESLSAGGSTHGSAGIQLAYEQAGQYFLKEGTNRVILATDGDLNVGITSDDALVELIKEKAAGGTFLTVLGFGTGNLKDGKLEKLADNGNGVYAYIDSMREGRKVLVEQMSGNLVTIAKDVKIQIEFNPAQIASYRLLGYENRVMAAADFNNDKKDAGEIGAGHTVTALYELVPVGTKEVAAAPQVGEPLKYQQPGARGQEPGAGLPTPDSRPPTPGARLTEAAGTGELLTLKLRYKEPDGVESRLVEFPLKDRGGSFHSASKDLQFAAAVASFGMVLRGSEHRGNGSLSAVAEIAAGALGEDASGHRAEFVDLVRKAQAMGMK